VDVQTRKKTRKARRELPEAPPPKTRRRRPRTLHEIVHPLHGRRQGAAAAPGPLSLHIPLQIVFGFGSVAGGRGLGFGFRVWGGGLWDAKGVPGQSG